MACSDCTIIVLDVRKCADKEFKRHSKELAAQITRQLVCAGKKHLLSFVLVGAVRTENYFNSAGEEKTHLNILEYNSVALATWRLLMNYYEFVERPTADNGNWLDALEVAVKMLQSAQEIFRARRLRIVLFYDFSKHSQNYAKFDTIANELTTECIELVVSSPHVMYKETKATGEVQHTFIDSSEKVNEVQVENQKYVQRLVYECSAVICSLKEVPNTVLLTYNKTPWCWNTKLRIGSKISIDISGIIVIKDELRVKLQRRWCDDDEQVTRAKHYFIKGTQVALEQEDLIDGYMLGGTPVPYDKTICEERTPLPPGLTFMGFVKRNTVPSEYYCADSLYAIVHKKGFTNSARRLDALVRASNELGLCMLCWKIFSVKFNNPKLVLLIPCEPKDDRPSMFFMVDIAYHTQHLFWDFPALRTPKTECTIEDLDAIDNLIDSMDLDQTDAAELREKRDKDLLPFDKLPHVFEEQLLDVLERKVLRTAENSQSQIANLAVKTESDPYWNVPQQIEERAKKAAEAVKQRFRLQYSTYSMAKAKVRCGMPSASAPAIESVRRETASEDFEKLVKQRVLPLPVGAKRSTKFIYYAKQFEEVLEQLITEKPLPVEQLARAMAAYRRRCWLLKSDEVYNEWITRMKEKAEKQDWQEFWQDVVVKYKLGIFLTGPLDASDKEVVCNFYMIEGWASSDPFYLTTADFMGSQSNSDENENISCDEDNDSNLMKALYSDDDDDDF